VSREETFLFEQILHFRTKHHSTYFSFRQQINIMTKVHVNTDIFLTQALSECNIALLLSLRRPPKWDEAIYSLFFVIISRLLRSSVGLQRLRLARNDDPRLYKRPFRRRSVTHPNNSGFSHYLEDLNRDFLGQFI
jgi:hypothetical protein